MFLETSNNLTLNTQIHFLSMINSHQTPSMGSKTEHFSRHIHKAIHIFDKYWC